MLIITIQTLNRTIANLRQELASKELSCLSGDDLVGQVEYAAAGLGQVQDPSTTTHPAYEKWNRRSGLAYLFPLVVFFGFAITATMQSSATLASTLAILMFPATLAVILIVWMQHRSKTFKFHQSWVLEHGLPSNPSLQRSN